MSHITTQLSDKDKVGEGALGGFGYMYMSTKGRRQNSPQYDDKNMLENIGDLFVKCMQQFTKGHLYHLLGVSDYYIMYRHRAQSVL